MKLQRPHKMPQTLLGLCAALMLITSVQVQASPASATRSVEPRQQEEGPALLTDDDIELIHVYEVHMKGPDGERPRIAIPRDTLNEFLEKYKSDDRVPRGRAAQREFLSADGHVQLQLMFDLRAREFYPKVRIKSQIESMRAWQKLHSGYVLGYFQQLYGSGQVKGVTLLPQGRDAKRVAMTNYYILTQTKINGIPMIDRNNPEESLLLQWGLPRDDAKFAAPEVDKWRPYYKDTQDERYVEMLAWIKSLIRANQDSTYDLTYKLPKASVEEAKP